MEANRLGRNLFSDVIADKQAMEVDRLIEALTDFAIGNDKQRCFPGWTRENVKRFFLSHFHQKTILFVKVKGKVVGFVTWYRWIKDEIDPNVPDDERFGNPPPFREDGDLLYISDVVTTQPRVMRSMGVELAKRNPDYGKIEIWGTRKNKKTGVAERVQYTKRLLDFINGGSKNG